MDNQDNLPAVWPTVSACAISSTDPVTRVIAAILALEDRGSIEKKLELGESLTALKASCSHGKLQLIYKNEVKKSACWCAGYMRLYKARSILPAALDWAVATQHDSAGRYAIEELLRIISDYHQTVLREEPRTPRAKTNPAPGPVGELREILSDARREVAKASDLSRDQLIDLTEVLLHRLQSFVQTCRGLQV